MSLANVLDRMTQEEILECMDALYAYDQGCTDSGIKDALLKDALKKREDIEDLVLLQIGVIVSTRNQGYGLGDIQEFIRWCEDELDVYG